MLVFDKTFQDKLDLLHRLAEERFPLKMKLFGYHTNRASIDSMEILEDNLIGFNISGIGDDERFFIMFSFNELDMCYFDYEKHIERLITEKLANQEEIKRQQEIQNKEKVLLEISELELKLEQLKTKIND